MKSQLESKTVCEASRNISKRTRTKHQDTRFLVYINFVALICKTKKKYLGIEVHIHRLVFAVRHSQQRVVAAIAVSAPLPRVHKRAAANANNSCPGIVEATVAKSCICHNGVGQRRWVHEQCTRGNGKVGNGSRCTRWRCNVNNMRARFEACLCVCAAGLGINLCCDLWGE